MQFTRAVNLSCELGGSAERMSIKCAVGHGTTSNLWYVCMETFEGQMTLKNKSQYFWISQDFLLYRRYLQIFLSNIDLCVWLDG